MWNNIEGEPYFQVQVGPPGSYPNFKHPGKCLMSCLGLPWF